MDISFDEQAIAQGRLVRIDNVSGGRPGVIKSFLGSHGLLVDHVENFGKGSPTMTHFHCYLVLNARDEVVRAISKLNGTFMLNFKLSVALIRKMPHEIQKQLSLSRRTANHEAVPTITSKKFPFDHRKWRDGQIVERTWGLAGRDGRRVWVSGFPYIPNQSMLDAEMSEVFKGLKIEDIHMLDPTSQYKPPTACLVDFSSLSDAKEVISNWNGRAVQWGTLRVAKANKTFCENGDTEARRKKPRVIHHAAIKEDIAKHTAQKYTATNGHATDDAAMIAIATEDTGAADTVAKDTTAKTTTTKGVFTNDVTMKDVDIKAVGAKHTVNDTVMKDLTVKDTARKDATAEDATEVGR